MAHSSTLTNTVCHALSTRPWEEPADTHAVRHPGPSPALCLFTSALWSKQTCSPDAMCPAPPPASREESPRGLHGLGLGEKLQPGEDTLTGSDTQPPSLNSNQGKHRGQGRWEREQSKSTGEPTLQCFLSGWTQTPAPCFSIEHTRTTWRFYFSVWFLMLLSRVAAALDRPEALPWGPQRWQGRHACLCHCIQRAANTGPRSCGAARAPTCPEGAGQCFSPFPKPRPYRTSLNYSQINCQKHGKKDIQSSSPHFLQLYSTSVRFLCQMLLSTRSPTSVLIWRLDSGRAPTRDAPALTELWT